MSITKNILKKMMSLRGFASCTITTPFGTIHYFDSEPGQTDKESIVFLHGLGGYGQTWAPLAALLQDKKRLILPDLFNMGGHSAAPFHESGFKNQVNALLYLLDFLDAKQFDFCGFSLGGWLSLKIAALQKEKVGRIVLLNPGGISVDAEKLRDKILQADDSTYHALYQEVFSSNLFLKNPFLKKIFTGELGKSLNSPGVKHFVSTISEEDFLDHDLHKIEHKVLLLWGEGDTFLSQEIANTMLQKLVNIQAYTIENCGHATPMEATHTCFQEICKFLDITEKKSSLFQDLLLRTLPKNDTKRFFI